MPSDFSDRIQREHVELLQWLKARQERLKTTLSVVQEQVPHWQQLNQQEQLVVFVSDLLKGVTYYDNVLQKLQEISLSEEPNSSKKNDFSEAPLKGETSLLNWDEKQIADKPADSQVDQSRDHSATVQTKQFLSEESGKSPDKNPRDFLRPEFQHLTMFEIIKIILNQAQKPLSTDEVTKLAYRPLSGSDLDRAKSSISTQLRRGAEKEKWIKADRGRYKACEGESRTVPNPRTVDADLPRSPWENAPHSFPGSNGKSPVATSGR